ncbi:chemotaxis response regulator protein-glutamate methylesterase [Colwellia sp. UCD-KL20]|uniref:protein-glutamate methylesterase/protein-glutamine glutaminase n=1 Tax=Colwellia sp. UCD-KL20 TaxID=1917165 RepID=UPI000970CD5E|nr:chemotaxis response regulator protein-glutamate methylesterase [Colwellia sp. UCD-KL20]
MPYKVLVVDDSSFFRRRLTDILNADPNLNVIDVAVNGIEAVEKAKILKPDVITMDIEMPHLNGIDAVKQIMKHSPTSIIMFSSLTHEGAKITLDALDAGALDFLPKKFSEIAKTTSDAGRVLRQRVTQLARKNSTIKVRANLRDVVANKPPVKKVLSVVTQKSQAVIQKSPQNYKILTIGTSTGGPIALQKVLTQLPDNFPVPILIVQHMPASFTKAFANRLNNLCKISVKEAATGDQLKAGHAYVAPGGKQMVIDGNNSTAKLKIIDDVSERVAFKPSVDITFASAARVFGKDVLSLILTGMGSDGKDGCRLLKGKGATVWSQDEESCVVYGMPQAVAKAGLSDEELPLDKISSSILKVFDLK